MIFDLKLPKLMLKINNVFFLRKKTQQTLRPEIRVFAPL